MPMPTNCHDCPACNEYLLCTIPVNGRKWGENDVREFGQGRPEWCPMKEQEADEPKFVRNEWRCGACGHVVLTYCFDINEGEMGKVMANYCPSCGRKVKWG